MHTVDPLFSTVRAVIFDLDGTLIDSMGIWDAVDDELITRLGRASFPRKALYEFRDNALLRHAGDDNPYVGFCTDLGRELRSNLDGREIHRLRHSISRNLLKTRMRFRPGAVELVKRLKNNGMALGIATTTKRDNVELYSSENPIMTKELVLTNTFSLILTREDVSRSKPDPEIYKLALEKLKVEPRECLVFEDSLIGIKAATAAGIPVCSIAENHAQKDLPAILGLVRHHFSDWQDVLTHCP